MNTLPDSGGAIANLLTEQRKPFVVVQDDVMPLLAVPGETGYTLQKHDRSAELSKPQRATGTRSFDDAVSFIGFFPDGVANKCDGATRLYCAANFLTGTATVTAIFNDSPGWRDFRAVYKPKGSVEWDRWLGNNGPSKAMTQEQFALFIEDNLQDIASVDDMPSGTDMLAMATSLELNADNRFKSAIRLQSGGVDLTYVDTEDNETLKKMRLFERFTVGIRVLRGGDAYRIDARLRYRTRDGKIHFWYELIRPDKTYEDALRAEIARIQTATAQTVLFGDA